METLEQTDTIQLTDTAADVVRNLLVQKDVPDHGLRIFVSGGGCSGMQYGMALDAGSGDNDQIFESEGVKVFVDSISMMYLGGSVVDYEDSLMGGGFRIDNPNAVSACGCGNSFKTSGSPAESQASYGGGCGCG
jgi:iron-sulfur cluster assembly accessory protein